MVLFGKRSSCLESQAWITGRKKHYRKSLNFCLWLIQTEVHIPLPLRDYEHLIKIVIPFISFLVPSGAPNLLRVRSFEFTSDLLVKWNPLSQYFANGKLLGYTIYYRKSSFYWSKYQSVDTSSSYPTQVKLKDLKPGQQYSVYVAAFTSKGVGPWSHSYYATTGMSL